MSTGLKVAGIIGVGAILSLGVLASEPESTVYTAPNPIVIPTETKAETNAKPKATTPVTKPVEKPRAAAPASNCHPSYSGCLKMNAGDYDCAGGSGNGPNYTGPVRVYGSDPFDLDRDNDGWGCE